MLLQLEAAAPVALPIGTIHQGVYIAGHDTGADDVLRELTYLSDMGYVESSRDALAQGLLRWRLTAEGRAYLEREGMA